MHVQAYIMLVRMVAFVHILVFPVPIRVPNT